MLNTYYFFVTATSTVCSLAFVARIDLQRKQRFWKQSWIDLVTVSQIKEFDFLTHIGGTAVSLSWWSVFSTWTWHAWLSTLGTADPYLSQTGITVSVPQSRFHRSQVQSRNATQPTATI